MKSLNFDRFKSRRSTLYAKNGVVATSHPLAAQVGIDILKNGGNAFDAAVATSATLAVVEPMNCGIGGDVFSIYRTSNNKVGAMRSCGNAPAEITPDTIRKQTNNNSMPDRGPLTITVPGTVRGWENTIQERGLLDLESVLRPAINYAIEGFPVPEVIADTWEKYVDSFWNDYAHETFLINGRTPLTGEVVKLPDLGKTLEKISTQGADFFYEGPIADKIADTIQEAGGVLSTNDLATFDSEKVDPISTVYKEATIYELPPNNQGLIALEALNIAEKLEAGKYDYKSELADCVHYFVESLKRAFHDGHYYITDPEFEDIPPLNDKTYACKRAATISKTASDVSVENSFPENSDTVLLTVADSAGNVVSYMSSLYKVFGSGLAVPNTGVLLQNRGSSFSLDPNHPNCLEPEKRPFHTLIPGLIRFSKEDWAAFGVMGGYMQPQGHLQVLSNILNYEMSIQEALDAARWRYRKDGTLAVEERLADGCLTKLAQRNHDVRIETPDQFGGAQIARNDGNILSAATEPRKDGIAVGF